METTRIPPTSNEKNTQKSYDATTTTTKTTEVLAKPRGKDHMGLPEERDLPSLLETSSISTSAATTWRSTLATLQMFFETPAEQQPTKPINEILEDGTQKSTKLLPVSLKPNQDLETKVKGEKPVMIKDHPSTHFRRVSIPNPKLILY